MNPAHALAAVCRTLARWIEPNPDPQRVWLDMIFEVFETGKDVSVSKGWGPYPTHELFHSATSTSIWWETDVGMFGDAIKVWAGHNGAEVRLKGSDARHAKRLVRHHLALHEKSTEQARLAALLPRFEAWLAQPLN